MECSPNFVSLHLRGWCSTDVFLLSLFALNSRKATSHPLTPACRVGRQKYPLPLAPHLRTQSSDLQSLVIFNYQECFGLAIQRRLSALFIYLFIEFLYELFNYVTIKWFVDFFVLRFFHPFFRFITYSFHSFLFLFSIFFILKFNCFFFSDFS